MANFLTKRLEAARPPGKGGDPALGLRALSALTLGPIAILTAVYGGWVLAGWVTFFAVAMSYEWLAMSDRDAPPRAYSIFAAIVSGASALAGAEAWLWSIGVIALGAALVGLERRRRGSAWRGALGAVYITLPCVALIWIRNGEAGGILVMMYLFAVVWAADIAAYLVGTWIGGPRLLPSASPNKTWSGLIAGLLAGGVAGFLFARAANPISDKVLIFTGFSICLALSAVLGDLLESSLKRRFGVKDAGTLIPGHGGVLDRVDALMAAVLFCGAAMLIWPDLFAPLNIGGL